MRNEDYYNHAEQAVLLEQKAEYQDAALYWRLAAGKARKEANQKWAISRSQICDRMHIRPFSRGEK